MKNILKKPNLFLDDIRMPHEATWGNIPYIYQNLEWDIVRNYDEFVGYVQENGLPKGYISFDHDLGDESSKTGLDCAKFLVYYCLYHGVNIPAFQVHSMNPVGRENIIREMHSYYRCFR